MRLVGLLGWVRVRVAQADMEEGRKEKGNV
jgi:hypothetical protein